MGKIVAEAPVRVTVEWSAGLSADDVDRPFFGGT
jgi:hypothetical protein